MSELVDAGGGFAEDGGLFGGGERGDVVSDDVDDGGVVAGEGADGPVGADHQARGAEGFEDGVEVRGEVFGRARCASRLR